MPEFKKGDLVFNTKKNRVKKVVELSVFTSRIYVGDRGSWGEAWDIADIRHATVEEISNSEFKNTLVGGTCTLTYKENRKIIGYRAPTDMYNGEVKKGGLFHATSSSPTPNPMYVAIDENKKNNQS